MSQSEVARLRAQIERENQAMHLGFSGFAISANHEAIIARMERAADRLLRLFQEGKGQEAIALMQSPTWGLVEVPDPAPSGQQEAGTPL